MNCDDVKRVLPLYLLGDLQSRSADKVRAHLGECSGCRAAAGEIEPTLDLLRDALAAPCDAPDDLTAEQMQRIMSTAPQPVHEPAAVRPTPMPNAATVQNHRLAVRSPDARPAPVGHASKCGPEWSRPSLLARRSGPCPSAEHPDYHQDGRTCTGPGGPAG